MFALPVNDDHVVPRREVIAAGGCDRDLARLVHDGILTRVRHGVYVDARAWREADPTLRHRLLARGVVRLYGADVALSHVSSCLEWGSPSWGLPLDRVHLTHLDEEGERTAAKIVHHRGVCRVGDVSRLRGGWVTTPARSVVETLPLVDRRAGVCLLDWVQRSGLADREVLLQTMRQVVEWPHSSAPSSWLDQSDGLADSVAESLTRLLIHDAGLPTPIAQHVVLDHAGRFVARVDFAWPELGLVLEFDGQSKYRGLRRAGETVEDVVLREKRREDAIREATGWRVIRLVWSDLGTPHATAERIRRALRPRAA